MSTDTPTGTARRVIKRYSNRKLYDTRDSRYVTLNQIGEMVRRGEDVQVIDNTSKEDKTEATLALILSEDLKSEPGRDQLGALRGMLQERGEKLLSSLREGPIGRLIPGSERPPSSTPDPEPEPPPPEVPASAEESLATDRGGPKSRIDELVATSRQTLGELQSALDERVQAVVPGLGLIRGLRAEIAVLQRRLEAIERHLGLQSPDSPEKPEDG
jgi:polyhydroxyalkanoate synthesis repressor PhaR